MNASAPHWAKEEISSLCRHFYKLGWVSGTGGGIAIREDDTIYMAPSGVEKERIDPLDVFTLSANGCVLDHPNPNLKLTECAPLFMAAFQHRNAGAVLHSHSLNVLLAAALVPHGQPLRLTRMEMMKGLQGVGYFDIHEIPVIHNTARESALKSRMEKAILAYPKSTAVIVRNHGVYIWGKNARHAKTQAECLDYLCEAMVRMHAAGIDHTQNDMSQPGETE